MGLLFHYTLMLEVASVQLVVLALLVAVFAEVGIDGLQFWMFQASQQNFGVFLK